MRIFFKMTGSLNRAAMIAVAIFVYAFVIFEVKASEMTVALSTSGTVLNLCKRTDPLMNPVYEVRHGQDVVWQIPPSPRAVLFIGHGMNKEPLSYFDPGPSCRQCYGLPEDRGVILAALQRGYAVILVKSVGPYWLPWNVESWPPTMSEDRTNVVSIIREWTEEHALTHLPLAAFGHSSGGNFSTLLTLDLDIKSLILMCTPGEFQVLERAESANFPPTLFVAMPVDDGPMGFYPLILKSVDLLESKEIVHAKVDALPGPITPHLFAEKIPCMGMSTSENIYSAYKTEGWLDENDYLLVNPRIADWESVLLQKNVLPFCEITGGLCYAKHVQQELMAAYAEHSFTSGENDAIFNWLEFTMFDSALFSSTNWTIGRASLM